MIKFDAPATRRWWYIHLEIEGNAETSFIQDLIKSISNQKSITRLGCAICFFAANKLASVIALNLELRGDFSPIAAIGVFLFLAIGMTWWGTSLIRGWMHNVVLEVGDGFTPSATIIM